MKRTNRLVNIFMEFVQIMMVFLGVSSAITATADGLELIYDRGIFLIFTAIGSVLFYFLFSVLETIRFGKLYGIGGLLVFYIAIAIRFYEELIKGAITIINNFLKAFMSFTDSNLALLSYKDSSEVDVNFSTTLVLVIIGVLMIAIVSAFFYRKRRPGVFILCTMPFMIVPLYVGRIGYFSDMLIYLSILIAVIGTRNLKTNSTDRKLRQKLSLIMLSVGLISGLIAFSIVTPARYERNKNTLLETKNTIMSLASWSYDDIFTWIRANWGDSAISYGKIGRTAEVNHTGRTLIRLSGDVNKAYGLYLKSYTANIYENNRWSSSKRNAQYKQDLARLSAQNIAPDSYHVQLRNDIGDNEKSGMENLWSMGELHITNLAFGFGNYVIPVLPVQAYITEADGSLSTRVPGIEYTEEYYLNYPYALRRMLMTPSEDLVDPVFWTTYEEKMSSLSEFAKKYYLQVPEELKGICDEFRSEYEPVIKQYEEGEGDISDVLHAVRDFITRDTMYTDAPGRTPSGRDTVEYFLKESKKGYCTYYATAAAILLRGIGIPTRYAEGLYVTPEELEKGIPGEISVPDYDAHAWIEVFDERYGFVTFETTPGRGEQQGESTDDGGYTGNGAGGDGPVQTTPTPMVTTKPDESMTFEDIDGNEEENESKEPENEAAAQAASGDGASGILAVIIIILSVLILIAAIAEGQRRLRKYIFMKKMSDMKDKRRRIRMTHRHLVTFFAKQGVRYSGQSMNELTEEIKEALGIGEELAGYYVEMVFRAAFGPDDMTEQEVFRFKEVYDEICMNAYREAGLIKKLYYMYVLAL